MSALQGQRLDVAARSIDLTSAVLRGTKMDLVAMMVDESARAAGDLVRWLARERVSEQAFIDAMSLGQNIAQCNIEGISLLGKLEQTAGRLHQLQLVLPGALGHTIVNDEKLRWISTTETVLLKYQGCDYVVGTLCSLFVSSKFEPGDPRHRIMAARIRPVMEKVVDSIHLHIVNMGHETSPLPPTVDALPKHFLLSSSLARAIASINNLVDCDIIITMDGCIADLIDWLLHHWTGALCLSVNNELAFEDELGLSGRKLTILIHNTCTEYTDCTDEAHTIKFRIGVAGNHVSSELYEDVSDPLDASRGVSPYRTALYDIRNPHQTRKARLNSEEEKRSEKCAQSVIRSIMELPVTFQENGRISVRIDEGSNVKFKSWVAKTPTILQRNLGNDRSTRLLYTGALKDAENHADDEDYDDDDEEYGDYEDDDMGEDESRDYFTSARICKWYPEIRAVVEMAYERCHCGCQDQELDDILAADKPNSGCLVTLIYTQTLLLITHALTESAGAEDVSNLRGRKTAEKLVEAGISILGSIAFFGVIRWDVWFRVVSAVITGLPYDMANEDTLQGGNTTGETVLWVAGSMTIAPVWLDLENRISAERSWSIKQLVGTMRGLVSDSAVIESDCSSPSAEVHPHLATELGSCFDTDPESVQVEFAVFSNTAYLYRMLCLVRSGSSLRVLDPAEAYRGSLLAVQLACKCEQSSGMDMPVHLWTIPDVISGWNGLGSPPSSSAGSAHITVVGSSTLSYNVALGLAHGNCVLALGKKFCAKCFMAQCVEENKYGVVLYASSEKSHKQIRYR